MSFLSRAFTAGEPEKRLYEPKLIPPKWSEESIQFAGGAGDAMREAAFFACVRLLADSVSTLPLRGFRHKENIRVLADPQPQLLQGTPYPGINWRDWLWMLMYSLAYTGNAFFYITARGADNRPTALMPINPNSVQIDPNAGNWINPAYKVDGKPVPSRDIVHFKRFPLPGNAASLSPVEELATTFDLAAAANRYGLRWFRDSANPSGVLSSDEELTPEQVRQAQMLWRASHQDRRQVAVLSQGLKWQPISITPEESQFLSTRQYQRSEIAMIFGIPPHMIGDVEKQTSYGTGVESQSIGFTVYTLRPWLECIEAVLGELLPRGMYVKFGIDALLRGDYKARQEGYQIAIQSGYLSVNEVRALEDREPIANGDIHLQPMNFAPLGYTPPEDPAPQPADDGDKEN